MSTSLSGLRVIEITEEIPGPYCTKLLHDLGATVYKVESPAGDPMRLWGPFPGDTPDPRRSGLFCYLNSGKSGATADFASEIDRSAVYGLIADADILVEDLMPEQTGRSGLALDTETLQRINPNLVVIRISGFGRQGPLRDRRTTSLTMQAAAGWINPRELGRPPVQAGARIPEYIAGAYAAMGGLTALRVSGATDRVVEVDVSIFESLLSTLPYPMLMAERLARLGLPTNAKAAPMLGIVRASDGWIGINCLTGQHWLDLCAMVGLPEFGEHQIAIMLGGPERGDFFAKVQPWLDERTVADIVELSQLLHIPAAPVNDGAGILRSPQYIEREFFAAGGDHDWRFQQPGPPFRLSKTPAVRGEPAPPQDITVLAASARREPREPGRSSDVTLPFSGLKVFDMSTFWAGAYLTCYLGAFGAEVIKVESIQRPDGHRYSGSIVRDQDDWYERGPLWQGTNLNKRDLTLDLNSDAGRSLARKLIAEADVVVENYSPRVVEQFGLDYESLTAIKPDVIMVRMPGFGLAGPWRNYVGWALNIEQLSGMSAVTGYPDGPPCNIQGPADPIAGVHAAVALMGALEHRRRTGEGQLIEVAQIEAGAAVTAEPMIEYSLTGRLRGREGNRHRSYPQGVYPTAVDDDWVALTVRDDSDWAGVLRSIARPELSGDPRLSTTAQRLANHDLFDEIINNWTAEREPEEIVTTLSEHGVPAERVLTPDRMYDLPQLEARGFYQELEHPITGPHRYPGWPFRITPGPHHHHRSAPPTLGQHNTEILHGLGLSDTELAELSEQHIIGNRLLNP
ncbi:CaiB/BaiF CoA transferase family protein [Nocardia vaccinii]|uniref:CaiB/BaiF CoA transferase family protein n=1 Tax=Nocardia vaccinii TaxID=1822 RepID=UPI000834CBE7|nr:CoA transferase [Nocardia vaccinii]